MGLVATVISLILPEVYIHTEKDEERTDEVLQGNSCRLKMMQSSKYRISDHHGNPVC